MRDTKVKQLFDVRIDEESVRGCWCKTWRPCDIEVFAKRRLEVQPQLKRSPCLRRRLQQNFITFTCTTRCNFKLEIKSFHRVTGDGKKLMLLLVKLWPTYHLHWKLSSELSDVTARWIVTRLHGVPKSTDLTVHLPVESVVEVLVSDRSR